MGENITGTSLVYNGRAAKSHYKNKGGGSNYLCLPNNPQYGGYTPGVQGFSPVYGVEYELPRGSPLSNYASVGGAPEAYGSRRVCVCVCVCVYVFHVHFSATAKN